MLPTIASTCGLPMRTGGAYEPSLGAGHPCCPPPLPFTHHFEVWPWRDRHAMELYFWYDEESSLLLQKPTRRPMIPKMSNWSKPSFAKCPLLHLLTRRRLSKKYSPGGDELRLGPASHVFVAAPPP